MVGICVDVAEEGPVVDAEFVDHLGDAGNVVVRGTDEADEGFPGVLAQDTDSGEFGSFLGEVGVGCAPLFVQVCQVGGEVEVVLEQV